MRKKGSDYRLVEEGPDLRFVEEGPDSRLGGEGPDCRLVGEDVLGSRGVEVVQHEVWKAPYEASEAAVRETGGGRTR